MDQSLYLHSLYISLPLMLFFGFHMLFARTPEKKIFSNFLLSRRLMGTALLILAANYCVHLFFSIRLRDVNATILMNLLTYFLCYWLFSSAMMTLLDNRYITRQRFARHIGLWLAFSALACVVLILPTEDMVHPWGLIALAAWLVTYGLYLSARLICTYKKAIKMFENTHSDDIGSYIRWLSIFTYWAVGYGVSCALLTFLPDEYVFIWILSSIPFYIYLYCCYQNYILFYEKVENAFLEDMEMSEAETVRQDGEMGEEDLPAYHTDIESHISDWMDSHGFCQPGITLNDLSVLLCTNRTYLSEYINRVYQVSFRDWITDLRIEYAKTLMQEQPQLRIQDISDSSGFLSLSHFTRTFTTKEGCSPARWRENIQ
ncbi:MAG: helix-turn-helix domain-containing protein [Prevotella sp.]